MKPRLSIIIVSFNTASLLRECLRSVFAQTRIPCEVIVVDNASSDESCSIVWKEFPEVILIENSENLGFGRANNKGFERSQAPYVLLLNSDAELLQDTGAALVEFLERTPRAGAVGPAVLLRDGQRQEKTYGNLPDARAMLNQNLLLCRLFPHSRAWSGVFIESAWVREMQVGWVSGVCVALRREAYAAVNGFDSEIFLYAEDLDLCLRLVQAGWTIHRIEDYAIRHWCGGSTKTSQQALRNAVMQQHNFLKIVDRSTGPLGQAVSRVLLGVGLVLRMALRSGDLLRPGPRWQLAQYRHCFLDLCGWEDTDDVSRAMTKPAPRPVTGARP